MGYKFTLTQDTREPKIHEVPVVVETVTAEDLAATPMPEIIEPAGEAEMNRSSLLLRMI